MPDDDPDLESLFDTAPPEALQRAVFTNFYLDRRDDSPWVRLTEKATLVAMCEPCGRWVRLYTARRNVSDVYGVKDIRRIHIGQCQACRTIYWWWEKALDDS